MGHGVLETGRALYHGLAGTFRIVLISFDSKPYVEPWLGMEGFDKHDHIVYPLTWPQDGRVSQWLTIARTLTHVHGYNVEMTVVPEPSAARVLLEHGYTVLLFSDAAYGLPEWRPDHRAGVRPWADLEAEITAGRILRAADRRLEEGDTR